MATRSAALSMILLGVLAACDNESTTAPALTDCPEPRYSFAEWDVISNESFAFRLPPGFEPDPSETNRYEFLTTDVRWAWIPPGQRPLDPPLRLLQYASCNAVIDGLEVLVEVGTISNAGNPTGFRYYAAATWLWAPRREVPGSGEVSGRAHLLFEIFSNDVTDRERAISTFFSLDFADEAEAVPPPVVDQFGRDKGKSAHPLPRPQAQEGSSADTSQPERGPEGDEPQPPSHFIACGE